MIRWLGQRDEFRCGPIALVNIMKWAGIIEFEGHKVNEKLAKGYLSVRCWIDKNGTFPYRFEPILNTLSGIKVEKHLRSSRINIKKHIQSGGIVLLDSYWWDKKKRKHIGHYSLFVDVILGGQFYYAINNIEGCTRALVRGRKLAKMLSYPRTIAYFIKKELT
jgi:hypothetical protein